MPAFPIVVVPPFTMNVGYYNSKFGIKFQRQATIYAVLYEQVGQSNTTIL